MRVHYTCIAFPGLSAEPICSVAKPDLATPHGQSSEGAAEGKGTSPQPSTLYEVFLEEKTLEYLPLSKNTNFDSSFTHRC